MDNWFVVPYSPYLTRMFRAHTDVKVCILLHVVKYVYKYVYKGSDRARIRLSRAGNEEPAHNEIQNYINARYVCAPEAIHRVFDFQMQERSASVKQLQVHLPEYEVVTFVSGAEQQVLHAAFGCLSCLTAYFEKNKNCSDPIHLHGMLPDGLVGSRVFHYFEIPEHLVHSSAGWKERGRDTNNIGRMYFVAPSDSEGFALRLLLLCGKGFTSYSDVLTVDGIEHPSYVAAARATGYLNDDSYFEHSLREAATTDFMEDYMRNTASTPVAKSRAFYDTAARIESFGKEWRDYLDIDVPLLSDSMLIMSSKGRCCALFLMRNKKRSLTKRFLELSAAKDDIVDTVFNDLLSGRSSDKPDAAILTPRNADALMLNDRVLDRLDGVRRTFLSEDEAVVDHPSDSLNFSTEFLNKMTPTGVPPHAQHMIFGVVVMLLCNGSRFIVTIGQRVLICEHASGRFIEFYRVSLQDLIFSHGQLYVAFSRARSRQGIVVDAPQQLIRNIVYEEMLR
ncbi:unnamed protein product [Heligmosomoides polygyrus]|uniref:ATP-dependent DNA helicase n=1 Tax=Heligmosomoides polygyrus TaxID=6339 RepID=A0A183FTM0_HELPZ|nr:unnamed protein product [Heligmosomoides polygyrus]